MEIKRKSHFKDIQCDLAWFDDWVNDLEIAKGKQYERMEVKTPLGITHVWGLNTEDHREKIKSVFLLNPGCLQPFSLKSKNLYYNLLPLIVPTLGNIRKFLDKVIFCKPNHQLSEAVQKLIVDYEHFSITRYTDRTQKPYDMDNELRGVTSPTYLLLGDRDFLFPYQHSIKQAQDKISTLKEIKVFADVGHGIETYSKAMEYIGLQIQIHR